MSSDLSCYLSLLSFGLMFSSSLSLGHFLGMLTGRFGIRATTGQAAIVAAIVSEVSTTGKLHKSGAKSLKIESASQNTGISAFFPHVVHASVIPHRRGLSSLFLPGRPSLLL